MKSFFPISLLLMALVLFVGCDKTNKYNPAKGKDLIDKLQAAEAQSNSLELAKLAVEQNKLLKDREGAMATMRKASRFCTDIQDSRERIETYSQIAASYSTLNAIVDARNALTNAMNAYQNWEEQQAEMDAKRKKEPTQGEIEALASDKIEILVNLARAQMSLSPVDAQTSLMLAKDQANLFSDILMKVDKLLDLATSLGQMESFENLQVVAAEIQAYLNGEVPATAKPKEEAPSDEAAGDDDSSDDENADEAEAEEAPKETKKPSDEEQEEIDGQQKGSRLSTLAGIFIKMKHKDAKAAGIKILDEAAEVAKTIDNKGKKAITMCEIAVNYAAAKEKEKAKALVDEAEPLAKAADSATREAADEALTNAKSAVGD
ncbi:MAG: hypothetical protein IJQ31_02895 [Thermoguttaceae bacterium]|nr:hypothetical protein [Thermoguttaceae bacterium]